MQFSAIKYYGGSIRYVILNCRGLHYRFHSHKKYAQIKNHYTFFYMLLSYLIEAEKTSQNRLDL